MGSDRLRRLAALEAVRRCGTRLDMRQLPLADLEFLEGLRGTAADGLAADAAERFRGIVARCPRAAAEQPSTVNRAQAAANAMFSDPLAALSHTVPHTEG